MTTEKRSLFIIQNAKAVADPLLQEAVQKLRSAGHRVELRPISSTGGGKALAREGVQGKFDIIVSAGGDGTLNEVVNGAMLPPGPPRAVAVLPYGTANDFATAAGLVKRPIPELVEFIATAPVRSIDLGKVRGRYFVNASCGGIGAEVTTDTPVLLKRLLGGFAYSLTGLVNFFRKTSRRIWVRAQKFSWRGSMLLFTVCNSRLAGGGFAPAPGARLDDGLFDVVVLPEFTFLELPSTIRDLLSQDKKHLEKIKYITSPWLDVRTFRKIQVNVDGEPMFGRHFHFELLHRGLPFILPDEAF